MISVDARALVAAIIDLVRSDPAVRQELAAALALDDRQSEYVTVEAYAASASLSESTIWKAIREGRIPSRKFGRARRVPRDAAIAPRRPTAQRLKPRDESNLGIGGGLALVRVAAGGGRR